MANKTGFQADLLSKEEAEKELTELRSKTADWRKSKFDPLRQHIQWLDRNQVLKIEEMAKEDVANLRSYIDRNIIPDGKNVEIVVRSSRIDDEGKKFRVFVSKERAK